MQFVYRRQKSSGMPYHSRNRACIWSLILSIRWLQLTQYIPDMLYRVKIWLHCRPGQNVDVIWARICAVWGSALLCWRIISRPRFCIYGRRLLNKNDTSPVGFLSVLTLPIIPAEIMMLPSPNLSLSKIKHWENLSFPRRKTRTDGKSSPYTRFICKKKDLYKYIYKSLVKKTLFHWACIQRKWRRAYVHLATLWRAFEICPAQGPRTRIGTWLPQTVSNSTDSAMLVAGVKR